MNPDVSSRELFEDDVYLKPVLEDDALLYNLDDMDDTEEKKSEAPGAGDAERRVLELQEELERLQNQFSEYRIAVQKSMEEQLSEEDEKLASAGPSAKALKRVEDADSDYFTSYSYNGMEFLYHSSIDTSRLTDIMCSCSYPRVHVERYYSHRCLPGFCLRQQASLQGQGCVRCRMWYRYPFDVLCQSRREDGHFRRQFEYHRQGSGKCIREWSR